MSGYLIDLFFSLRGRASRQEWLVGCVAIAVAAAGGVYLFNDASFDESINAVPEIPTMAAFFWAILCLVAFATLSVKRLKDADLGGAAIAAVTLPASLLVLGWAIGSFPAAPSARPEALVFWTLVAMFLAALLLCLRQRRES